MKKFAVSLVIFVGVLLLGGIGIIYSGTIDVAATTKDSELLHWALETIRERSIEIRSSHITAPSDAELNKPKTALQGFEHYNEMCIMCHGAPGIDPGEAREGMNPKPPLLAKAKHLQDEPIGELFWVIKNGIKMPVCRRGAPRTQTKRFGPWLRLSESCQT